MGFFSCFPRWRAAPRPPRRPQTARARPALEGLEDRTTPSAAFAPQTAAGFQNFAVNNGDLTVNGDQLGAGYADSITVGVIPSGGVVVNLNGQTASFGDGQIRSVTVNTGAGSNSVIVSSEAAGVPLVINDGGYDFVRVGSGGNVQGILGSVTINNPFNFTNLFIDDSADLTGRLGFINSTYVSGLAPADINFSGANLSYLTIFGGSGGNTFYVFNTPSTYNVTYPGYTWLSSGTGSDTVIVTGTAGGDSLGLYLNGDNGHDVVHVGGDTSTLGSGSLANIKSPVSVFNSYGATDLYLDDGADATGRTATLTGSSLTGLSDGAIYWTPSASFSGGVTFLDIFGAAAGSTYNVPDSPNLYYYTNLNTGAGNDKVNITGTSDYLATTNGGGTDSVYVGSTTLANINGAVYASGVGSTYLFVEDILDTTSRNVTLNANSLFGLSTGAIYWASSKTSASGVVSVSIVGSSGDSSYNVTDTASPYTFTTLTTGYGNDSVAVGGTTGNLSVNSYGGQEVVSVGDGTMSGINGLVYVSGSGSTFLYIHDYNDATARRATLTSGSLTGLSRGAIQWTGSAGLTGGVTYLGIMGSGVASTYTVTGTPNLHYATEIDTGVGNDAVFVTGTTGGLYVFNTGGLDTVVLGRVAPATSGGKVAAIKGMVNVYGFGSVTMVVDDSGDTTGRAVTLTSLKLTGLAPAPIYFGANVKLLTISTGSGNDVFTVTGIPTGVTVRLDAGGGNDALIGPNTRTTWNITGVNAGNINNTLFFSNVERVIGGSGVDTFVFGPTGRVDSLSGGGAPAGQGNWLDYSAYLGAVTVNLATGKATGVTGAISSIQNVFGGDHGNALTGNSQGNILVGGAGADTVTGGSGRSLLIGGKGSDTVVGGSADDILSGGATPYDQAKNEPALMAALAEWQSGNSYAARITYILQNCTPLVSGISTLDDGGADKLTGGAGLDWFLVGTLGSITDLSGEKVNLNANLLP